MRRNLLAVIAIAVTATALHAHAQGAPPAFEVASVKPNTERMLSMSGVLPAAGGRVQARATTLKDLIASAYATKRRDIVGGPAWLDVDRFDIEARAGTDVPWNPGLRRMLQALLGDRFKLKSRAETREVPVYALVVDKSGPKMRRAADAEPCPASSLTCGLITRIGLMTAAKASARELADALSQLMDRPVIDRTGLTGIFADVRLAWVPDETQFADFGPGQYQRLVSDPAGPSIFAAVQEQLGLKLEPARAPVTVIVIDGAERPSPD